MKLVRISDIYSDRFIFVSLLDGIRDQSEGSVTIYGVIEDPQKAQKHSLKESYKELTRNVGDFSDDP
ncbi:hypothetical protein Peur_029962 [Populus x canadensis]